MNDATYNAVSKVPQVTLIFWIIKILATTLGETGGDAVTMSWLGETTAEATGTGYLIGTAIFLASEASNYVSGQIIYVDGGMVSVL